MAKSHKMNRGVGKNKGHDEGKTVDLPNFVHAVDSYGNIFCSLPDMDRIYPRYHTLEELEDACRWRETDLITDADLKPLAELK